VALPSPITGVLLDWRGTLVCDPAERLWIGAAAASIGRPFDAASVAETEAAIAAAAGRPDLRARMARAGCDRAEHRDLHMEIARVAGVDPELARALYELDFDPAFHPMFPDVAGTLAALSDRGVRIGVLSDIHFDLRPEFEAAGLARYVDAFVLSYEHGVQKPDAAIFELALEALGVDAPHALMVGDDVVRDGGASLLGIPTLLLPPLREVVPRGLGVLVDLV
jgi:FMN phosphatase YigB (HAD superfamily)